MKGQAIPTLKRFSDKLELDGFVERIPSFTTGKAGIFLTSVGLFLNLLNMYTDYALGITFIQHDHYYWGAWTLAFVIVPSFFISLYTFILHKESKGKFLMKVKVSNVIVYWLCAILHGHLARCIMWLILLFKRIPLLGVKTTLWAFRDITSYAETFTQSFPQLCLQLYIMGSHNGYYTALQAVCFVSSCLSAAWGLTSEFVGVKWKLIAFEINLFWFVSRAVAVVKLANVSKVAIFGLLFCHFLIMFLLWFWQNGVMPFRKKKGARRFKLMTTDAFYAVIYASNNTVTPITCKYQYLLASLLLIENVTCMFIGYSNILEFACTALGFIQVALISFLRRRNYIEDDSMMARLGSPDYKKKTRGRVKSYCGRVTVLL